MADPHQNDHPPYEQGTASARTWFDRQLLLDSWDGRGLSPINWVVLTLIILSVILFTVETMEAKSNALANTARVWDDGIIDPADTRAVVAFALSVCREADERTDDAIGNAVDKAFGKIFGE